MTNRDTKVADIPATAFDSVDEAVESIFSESGSIRPGFWIALNAEKIMAARRDPAVRATLMSATQRYADGIAVVWAMRRMGVGGVRIPGCDIWEVLMQRASELDLSVYLVGGRPEVMKATRDKLKKSFGLELKGAQDGYFDDPDAVIEDICNSGAKIVTVALGSPRQERFIQKCRARHAGAFYMGVGGTYDVFVGAVKRAPRAFRKLHLEWFYRLVRQPSRIGRQAVYVKYLILMFMNRL